GLFEDARLLLGATNLALQQASHLVQEPAAVRDRETLRHRRDHRHPTDQPRTDQQREREPDPGSETEMTRDELAEVMRTFGDALAYRLEEQRLRDDRRDLVACRRQDDPPYESAHAASWNSRDGEPSNDSRMSCASSTSSRVKGSPSGTSSKTCSTIASVVSPQPAQAIRISRRLSSVESPRTIPSESCALQDGQRSCS